MTTIRWRQKDEVAVAHRGDALFVLDLDRLDTLPHVLTDSGVVIWSAMNTPHDLEEIAAHVADTYGEPVEAVRPAVQAFLNELFGRGLVIHD